MAHNEVTHFMWYMYNHWSITEAKTIFGDNLGEHIWNKWLDSFELSNDHTMYWYAQLDENCRNLIVEHSKTLYG